MPHAKLTVDTPPRTWIHQISTAHPTTRFRIIAVLAGSDRGAALVEIRAEDPVSLLGEIADRPDIATFELLWNREGRSMIQIETTNPLLLFPLIRAGVPIQTPFDVVDGVATWTITTSSDSLSALGDRLDEADVSFDLEYVRGTKGSIPGTLLTDRQREVMERAAEEGYYDVPRRTTLTAVADSIGISKATMSDILHRAESSIVTWFLAESRTAQTPPI